MTPLSSMPAWLQGKPLNEWIAIPGTQLNQMTVAQLQPLITAGLLNAQGVATTCGNHYGKLKYGGGALKRAGSELLILGGGGAGAWAGNDVCGLRLGDDAPAWSVRVAPSPASAVWPRGSPAHPYMQDGTPNARHSYWQPQFDDESDTFYTFGCQNVWEIDNGTYNVVDSAPLGGTWAAQGSHPNIPHTRGYDGSWVCSNPATRQVYASSQQAIDEFDIAANTWATVFNDVVYSGIERGCAAIDPSRGKLLRIGQKGIAKFVPVTFDLTSHAITAAVFSGPYAASVASTWAAGFVFDLGLDCFLFFRDDGYLYTVRYVSDAEWFVDRLTLTGVPPSVSGSTLRGNPCAIWGTMQHCPELGGVVLLQVWNKPVYFVKTA